jgi:hypothetical protein
MDKTRLTSRGKLRPLKNVPVIGYVSIKQNTVDSRLVKIITNYQLVHIAHEVLLFVL